MGKFRKDSGKELPAISTASLPDIIFMLLFFFMVTTVMRETELIVKVKLPQATEVQKLEKKSLVSYIYVGIPSKAQFGTESRIQLNDRFATVNDIISFVESERQARDEADRNMISTSLKVDKDTRMGIVSDIKQELRKASAFKMNYSTLKKVKKD